MERKTNVRLTSNVYPVHTENVAADPAFRRQVRGRNALMKLAECVDGKMSREELYERSLLDMGVETWQMRLYWHGDLPCSYADGDRPYGLVLRDGVPTIECRCIRKNCHNYTRCLAGR